MKSCQQGRRARRKHRSRGLRNTLSLERLEARQLLTAVPTWESGLESEAHTFEELPAQVYAPYVDGTLWPPFDFVEMAREEGVNFYTLAFVVADPATSEPSWGGYYSVSSGYRGAEIEALRELGGEVMVSFGGAAGTELAVAIQDVDELTQAYQSVIDQYQLNWIDFDIEGAWVADWESIDRRSQAIRNLQDAATADQRALEVWFTLPVLPTGLTRDGLQVVRSALEHGVAVGGVNIMAMDYGDGAAPNPEGQMGRYAIEAATSLFQQLRDAYAEVGQEPSDAELWRRIGVTPMIGQNDIPSERFYLEDARELLEFAQQREMGLLSAWSANRDSACAVFGQLALHCSGVPQEPREFSRTFDAFTTSAEPALRVSDVAVLEGDPVTESISSLQTSGNQIVDAAGQTVKIAGVSWFGMETDTFSPHGLWARNWQDMMDQMRQEGFNTIRLPFSNQLFDVGSVPNGIDFSLNPDLVGLNGLEIMDKIVAYAGDIDMRILLDRHRSAAGAGPNASGLWYEGPYSEERWISDWTSLASRYADQPAVIGADLHNEPMGPATWGSGEIETDWRLAAERAGNAILAVNPEWLIVVEGIQFYQDGTSYWWGGNLENADNFPVRLDVPNRLVYSPHAYPASVYAQPWFNDPAYPANLPDIWDRTWGYLYHDNVAPILLGEFGSRLETMQDRQWVETMVQYLGGDFDLDGVADISATNQGPSWTWWSWNPNSSDTGGILDDDWQTVHRDKIDHLETLQFEFPDVGTATTVVVNVPVRLSPASAEPVTVSYVTRDDSAVAGEDYQAASGTLTFAPGQTEQLVQILVQRDDLEEADETFQLELFDATGAPIAVSTGQVTILDDDTPRRPVLSLGDLSLEEGDEGTKVATWTISLDAPAETDVTVNYATEDGTAEAGSDYEAVAGTLTIPAGETQAELAVTILGDSLEEADEQFHLLLSDPQGVVLANAQATATILDDDQVVAPPGFTYQTNSDWGSGFTGEIELTNNGETAWSEWTVEFDWDRQIDDIWNAVLVRREGNRHVIRNEYWNGQVPVGGSISFGFLGSPGNVEVEPWNVLVNGVPIDGTPPAPRLSIQGTELLEGDAGTTTAEFLVELSRAATEDITVAYTSVDGAAQAGSDYEPVSGVLTIPAGQLEKRILVSVLGDTEAETDEQMEIVLSDPQGAKLTVSRATATILNDDGQTSAPTFAYRTLDDWGSGFNGEITLTNNGVEAWDGWTVEFDWEHHLTQVWNGKLASRDGDHHVVTHESWNGKVLPGASVTFGFGGRPGNVTTEPHHVVINGIKVGNHATDNSSSALALGSAVESTVSAASSRLSAQAASQPAELGDLAVSSDSWEFWQDLSLRTRGQKWEATLAAVLAEGDQQTWDQVFSEAGELELLDDRELDQILSRTLSA